MKKLNCFFLILLFIGITTANAQDWTQIGDDIDGEAASDLSGQSVSLSSDGSTVAIGATKNDGNGSMSGHVRIYQNNAGIWTQIGADIDGEAAGDESGNSVSLSSDGSVVAIGAYKNDGNGTSSGHVRIYQNNAGTWTQIGADIDGELASDNYGGSVSLSSDGSVVAIGATGNDGNGGGSGHVRIYQNIAGTWTQIGADIDGEAEYDNSGYSVSLSSDGSVVAIGAIYNDGNGSNSGHVRIYRNIGGVWTQRGADIDGEAAGDQSGNSVSLSSDGSIVAIGASGNDGISSGAGHVRIYQDIAGTWTQIGADIDGEAAVNDNSGYSVSLSSDGSVVAIGAPRNDYTGTDAGHVRIYQNNSGTWTQRGADINGEVIYDFSGNSVSLSSDGSVIAIGANQNDGNGSSSGHVRIYQIPTWRQTGADIDGEAASDQSGWSVSLSSDGSTVAIGAPNNAGNGTDAGHVRIYQNNAGTWTQIGADIDGEAAGDRSGESVSLSSDGSVVAIGAIFNAGNGTGAGHVRIYQNNSGTWIQIGDDIDGEAEYDYSGCSVSLSSDGSIVAIGAYGNDGNGGLAGHVRIYQNNSGTWTQIGDDIDGEGAGNYSGKSVSLSSDGSVVAIGATRNAGNGSMSGHVRIYQNNDGTWTQVGADIDGEAASDQSGSSVSLSSDGSVVAIGSIYNAGNGSSSGHVRIYQDIAGIWTQIGADIDGEAADDYSGCSVSLSSDGSVVAIGANQNDGNGSSSGHVRIYQNDAGTWTQIGDDIDGEAAGDKSGRSVSLSSGASIVAIGATGNDGNVGHVRVYKFPMPPAIASQPANQTDICSGAEVIFSVTGYNINTYQWQVSTNGGDTWSDLSDNTTYSGATTNTLTVTSDISLNNYQYSCTVSNTDGDITSDDATLNFETEDPVTPTLADVTGECDATAIAPTTTDNCAGTVTGTTSDPVTYTTQGTHVITWNFDDGNGNSIDVEQNVIIDDITNPTITCVGNQEVDADDTHTYTAAGTGFDPTSTDDNCEVASVINDFNSSSTLNGASLPEGLTTIVWTVTDAAGNNIDCSFDVNVNAFVVGIEALQQSGISIYPNPTNGIINIVFAENNIQQIKIFDISGKTIIEKTAIQQNETIDLSGFENGIYIISIQTNKEIFTVKIVKE